jgi:hypothetical protein
MQKLKINDIGAKAPKSNAERKAAQRARLKEEGLARVKFPEIWVTPEQAKRIEVKTANVIAQVLTS